MKHRILVAAASLVLAALILLLLPAANDDPGISIDPGKLPNWNRPTGTSEPSQSEQGGVVRLYSCDEQIAAFFTELAAEYADLTGMEVVVLRQEADGCQATLQRYMESEEPPTVLCIHSQSQLKAWKDTLLDLNDTELAAALCNDSFGLRLDGKLLGVPAAVEGYGLLFNAELLGTKGALSRNDIFDLSSLSTAAQILKNNSVKAFPTTAFTLQDARYLLMSEDLQNARRFIDLYMANCSSTGNSKELFLSGQAVFCLGGTWEYNTLAEATNSSFHVRNLDILPTYAAGAMQYVFSTAWCVNASARQEDIDATLDFLTWMVTAGEEGGAPVDRLEMLSPFADATWYGNWLENKLRGYMLTEAAVMHWKDSGGSASQLLLMLNAYVADSTDANWDALCAAVAQFKTENG